MMLFIPFLLTSFCAFTFSMVVFVIINRDLFLSSSGTPVKSVISRWNVEAVANQ